MQVSTTCTKGEQMKIDYATKQEVLKNGLYARYKKAKKNETIEQENCETINDIYEEFKRGDEFGSFVLTPFLECEKLYLSEVKRKRRLRERIRDFLDKGECLFITLTFSDNTLKETNEETRRKYVRTFLKQDHVLSYLANIDFGVNDNFTKREHYHAVVLLNDDKAKIEFSSWYEYGGIHCERIRKRKISASKLSCYITKLSYHALKENGKYNALIYSR